MLVGGERMSCIADRCGALTNTVTPNHVILCCGGARHNKKKRASTCRIYTSTASILTRQPEGNFCINIKISETFPCGQGATVSSPVDFCIGDQLNPIQWTFQEYVPFNYGRYMGVWSRMITAENSRRSSFGSLNMGQRGP